MIIQIGSRSPPPGYTKVTGEGLIERLKSAGISMLEYKLNLDKTENKRVDAFRRESKVDRAKRLGTKHPSTFYALEDLVVAMLFNPEVVTFEEAVQLLDPETRDATLAYLEAVNSLQLLPDIGESERLEAASQMWKPIAAVRYRHTVTKRKAPKAE